MIGFLNEHTLSLVLFIAWLFTLFWLMGFRKQLQMNVPAAAVLSFAHVALGVFCVKFFAFLESGADAGGFSRMSLFGAVFFLPAVYWLASKVSRRDPAEVFDIFCICTVFTLLCARFNCLIAGCCAGRAIFGTAFTWPVRQIEILYYGVFVYVFAPKVLKGNNRGTVYPWYMLSYGLLRFVLEFLRETGFSFPLHPAHGWALLSMIIGAIILRRLDRKKRANHGGIRT